MSISWSTLYYIGDPMCSWCWGFHPVLNEIVTMLPEDVELRYVMGGLAKDSDEPMPSDMREYIQNQWRAVAERTGVTFNWDFWTKCQPRRSTYPACRAVHAATMQDTGAGPAMYNRIQQAYYLEARNPSDIETLTHLASDLSLDADQFSRDILSPEVEQKLQEDFSLRRALHANQFPSLLLEHHDDEIWLATGYEEPDIVLDLLQAALLS